MTVHGEGVGTDGTQLVLGGKNETLHLKQSITFGHVIYLLRHSCFDIRHFPPSLYC